MSGRRPPGVGATLSTLFRSALDQLGSMREAVDRGTQLQRNWFDATLLHRKRKDALALLGEAVYRAAVAGQLERVSDDPQFRRLVDDIDELDQRIEVAEQRAQTEGPASAPRPSPRPQRTPPGGAKEPRVWRPVAAWNAPDAQSADDADPHGASARRRRPSRTGEVPGMEHAVDPAAYPDDYDALDGDEPPDWAGVVRAAPRRPFEPSPDALGDDFGHRIEGDDAVSAFSARATRRVARDGGHRGDAGHRIEGDDAVSAFPARVARHFGRADDGLDDDLEQYMHEDDVPELAASEPAPSEPTPGAPPTRRRSRAAAAKRARQSSNSDS